PLAFDTANSNAIHIASQSTGTIDVELTFTTDHGILDVAQNSSFPCISINAALQGLSFIPTAGFSGLATIGIRAEQFQSGLIGEDSDSVDIQINTAPVL